MEQKLSEARELIKEGNLGKALEIYQEAHRKDPGNLAVMRYLASIHTKRGDLDLADEILEKLTAQRSDSQDYVSLAQNSLKRKQWDRAAMYAREALQAAIQGNGYSAEARAIMGDSAFRSGDLAKAADHYTTVLSVNPLHLRALTGRGTVSLSLKEYDSALEFFERALSVNPHHARAILGKGLVFLSLGRKHEAASLIEESLLLEPDNAWAIATLLPLLTEDRKFEQADDVLKHYLEHFPDDYPLMLAKAGIAFKLGRLMECRKLLDQVLDAHPEYPGAQELDRELKIMVSRMNHSREAVSA